MAETQVAGTGSTPDRRRFLSLPSTKLGSWSVILAGVFVSMFIINVFFLAPSSRPAEWRTIFLPFFGIGMLAVGLAAGIVGLVAVLRRERSWLVWLAMLPGLMTLSFTLGEFLVSH